METSVISSTVRDEVVIDYWDKRAVSYSNGVEKEFDSEEIGAWTALLKGLLSQVVPGFEFQNSVNNHLRAQGFSARSVTCVSAPRVMDLGCGPGFFEVLLSNMGCAVVGVDSSASMLENAWRNVSEYGRLHQAEFICSDVASIGFEPAFSGQFDVVLSRNVTWLMKNPEQAYRSWMHLLRPGGMLVVFDANWYRYLADEATNETRLIQQQDSSVLGWESDEKASEAQERACEAIARKLPLTYELRPEWDKAVLSALGFRHVAVNEDIWKHVWAPGEQAFYASSPLFMITALK